jgi:hypothetical protein
MTLQDDSHLVSLEEFGGRCSSHLGSTARQQLDETFGGQPVQRLTNRRARQAGLIDHRLLLEERALGEVAVEDGVARPLVGAVAGRHLVAGLHPHLPLEPVEYTKYTTRLTVK